MGNEKKIKEIPCKLSKKRIIKKGKIESTTIDSNAKCKIAFFSDGRNSMDGILETSKPLSLLQKETIKLEYELEFRKPILLEHVTSKIPMTILQTFQAKDKTFAQFVFVSALENKKKCILTDFRIAETMSEIGFLKENKALNT